MKIRAIPFVLSLGGLLLAFTLALPASQVLAQCGSESSTCRNCHEVQSEAPVNSDGTGWHESHAFGDFCYICHAGNQQAPSPEAAHESMVPPLSDTKASCQSCHANDLDERAAVYTALLGVSFVDENAQALATLATTPLDQLAPTTSSTATTETIPAVQAAQAMAECTPLNTQLAVDDPNLVDYVHHYNRVVLGEQPVNWGNIAVAGAITLLVLGGGSFVLVNEMQRSRKAELTARIEGEFPADVVDLLPELSNLNAQSRKSLKRILGNPEQSEKVLNLIDAVVETDDETKE